MESKKSQLGDTNVVIKPEMFPLSSFQIVPESVQQVAEARGSGLLCHAFDTSTGLLALSSNTPRLEDDDEAKGRLALKETPPCVPPYSSRDNNNNNNNNSAGLREKKLTTLSSG
ncbi:unnamed protein product [Boreogadus saida]